MDAKLRRALDAIARDNHSGAAEIALTATASVQSWLRHSSRPSDQEFVEAARQIVSCKPRMIPLLRLANEIVLSTESKQPGRDLAHRLRRFRVTVTTASNQIARSFRRTLARLKAPARVVTYSYSSTVLRALLAARQHIRTVVCSEARPGYEGRHMARPLASAGIWVQYKADVDLLSGILDGDVVIVGADAVLRDAFCNRTGTEALLLKALDVRTSFCVATDSTKLWPATSSQQLGWELALLKPGSGRSGLKSLWAGAPKNVDASYLEESWLGWTHFRPGIRFVTEKGWMTPKQVRAELKKIRISPRLKTLVD